MITSDESDTDKLVLSVVVEEIVLQFIILSEEDEKKGGTFYRIENGKKFESIENLLNYYSEKQGGHEVSYEDIYYDDDIYSYDDLDENARNFVCNLKLHNPISR